MIDGKNVFDQPVKNDKVTYGNIRKITNGQGDDYTTGCLLDYIQFKNHCKMIAVDLSKQQALDDDPKAIQHQTQVEMKTRGSISFLKKEKKLLLNFHTRNCKKFVNANIIRMFYFYKYKNGTQYNSLNIKLSNSKLKLKSAIKMKHMQF